MSADRLRQAAQKIRDTAQPPAADGAWYSFASIQSDLTVVGHESATRDAAHIAMWSPPVALAVATWLDLEAVTGESMAGPNSPFYSVPVFSSGAEALADLILGGAE
jgi:hypothetical protein